MRWRIYKIHANILFFYFAYAFYRKTVSFKIACIIFYSVVIVFEILSVNRVCRITSYNVCYTKLLRNSYKINSLAEVVNFNTRIIWIYFLMVNYLSLNIDYFETGIIRRIINFNREITVVWVRINCIIRSYAVYSRNVRCNYYWKFTKCKASCSSAFVKIGNGVSACSIIV